MIITKCRAVTFIALIILIELSLLFFPEVAEARGGGRRGGTLWWIPLTIIGGAIYLVNKKLPGIWDWLGGLTIIILLSFAGALFLDWIGVIEHEYTVIFILFIFLSIMFGPHLFQKIRKYISTQRNNGT